MLAFCYSHSSNAHVHFINICVLQFLTELSFPATIVPCSPLYFPTSLPEPLCPRLLPFHTVFYSLHPSFVRSLLPSRHSTAPKSKSFFNRPFSPSSNSPTRLRPTLFPFTSPYLLPARLFLPCSSPAPSLSAFRLSCSCPLHRAPCQRRPLFSLLFPFRSATVAPLSLTRGSP
jgi:hypothetical protein